ncbi:MAG: SDR family NAD(P)-dependent oxidoreductase [Aeoliella sp.]
MNCPLDLSNRRILVTGASSGIGRETCLLLAELGAKVVLAARNEATLSEVQREMIGEGHQIAPIDLTEVDPIVGWTKSLADRQGPFDGIVHSAGMQATRPLQMLDGARINQLMQLNLTSALQLARGLRQRSVHRKPASIVFISSVMGLVGQPAIAAYAASKGALIAATKALALELAVENIRVNCIASGHVKTPMANRVENTLTKEQFESIEKMHPLGFGTPRDVAGAIAFLLADTGRWITGTTLVVDGGYTAH